MGRAVVTKGHRRIGRTIRKLEDSVEFSAKESRARIAEKQHKEIGKGQTSEDSPVENLRDAFCRRKDSAQL